MTEVKKMLTTPDHQGAFGYFLINQTYNTEKIYNNIYFTITGQWYGYKPDYGEDQIVFNSLIFEPFVKLLNYYISDSKSYNENDFFSKIEINEISLKLDNLSFGELMTDSPLNDIRLGQEIIFNAVEDLKLQLKHVKKKTWAEILKGKLVDLVFSNYIIPNAFSVVVKIITGQDTKLLG